MPSRSRKPLAFVEPMAATPVAELPRGPEWSYEIKFDGYRVLALKDGDRVRLLSRKNKDLTRDFPSVAAAVSRIRASTAMLDGEIVAVDEAGVPRFQAPGTSRNRAGGSRDAVSRFTSWVGDPRDARGRQHDGAVLQTQIPVIRANGAHVVECSPRTRGSSAGSRDRA